MHVVMVIRKWDSAFEIPINFAGDGIGFLEVFETRELAEKNYPYHKEHIFEVRPAQNEINEQENKKISKEKS